MHRVNALKTNDIYLGVHVIMGKVEEKKNNGDDFKLTGSRHDILQLIKAMRPIFHDQLVITIHGPINNHCTDVQFCLYLEGELTSNVCMLCLHVQVSTCDFVYLAPA